MGAALLASFAGSASLATAQDARMSPTTGLVRGSFLVTAYPVLIPGGDDEVGFFLRGAYGASDRLGVHRIVRGEGLAKSPHPDQKRLVRVALHVQGRTSVRAV